MRFRLTYNGPLLASQPQHLSMDKSAEIDKRAAHKHAIRRNFHPQLKGFWKAKHFLDGHHAPPALFKDSLPPGALGKIPGDHGISRRMDEMLGFAYGHSGFRFVPLIRKELFLTCSLRILCLRRDHLDAVLPGRDIDNRVKTLIDALCAAPEIQKAPLGADKKPTTPQDGEDPFYVLLDDDRQITHLEIETDTSYELPSSDKEDESFVRLVVTVETKVTRGTMFNLNFA